MEEVHFKKINSCDLWKRYEKNIENLSIEKDGLCLRSNYEYEFIKNIAENFFYTFLFNWEEIPVNDYAEKKIKDFLEWKFRLSGQYRKFNINWVKKAKFEKIDDKTIRLYFEKNFLTLELNDEKTKVSLNINGVRTEEFIAKTENEKIKIYSDEHVIHDIAVDECDIIYYLVSLRSDMEKNSIFVYDQTTDIFKKLEIAIQLTNPKGIGIDNDTIYAADSGSEQEKVPPSIIAISRGTLKEKWKIFEDHIGEPFEQFEDLATGYYGDIFILEKKRIVKISISSNIDNKPIPVILPIVLTDAKDIAIDKDDNIYVLDSNCLRIFDKNGAEKSGLKIYYKGHPFPFIPKGLSIDKNNIIYIGQSNSDNPTIYRLDPKKLENEPPVQIWSAFRDTTQRLINDSKSNLYVINGGGNKLSFLEYIKVNTNQDGFFSSTYESTPIDSYNVNTIWQRFILEGDFKAGTQVEFWYYISNEKFDAPKWKKCLLIGSSTQGETNRDALFNEDNKGQYLRFKIILTGTETTSPSVRSLTLFFPEMSYINYLPAIYQGYSDITGFQEDTASGGFVARFLSIFESIFFDIDFNIDHLTRLFDAWGAPPDFLPWLGSWLAIAEEENFSEKMKRLYIQRAISLYKKRGTWKGLEETIAFYLYTTKHPDKDINDILAHYREEKPFIIESFFINRLIQDNQIKCRTIDKDHENVLFLPEKLNSIYDQFAKEPFVFYVFLNGAYLNENILATVRRIIEEQKPAHTCYGIKILEPQFSLDTHTYLGVNTYLTKPVFVLDETSVIGWDMILDERWKD